jgi:hypothetical protein
VPQDRDAASLTGSWLHSHEEDEGDRVVFRPASYDFPPARGRNGFELSSDGDVRRSGPGPDDRTQEARGRWKLVDGELQMDLAGGRRERYAVESAERGRLVLRRLE